MSEQSTNMGREQSLLSEISDLREAIDQLKALNDLALRISLADDLEEINRILIRKALEVTQAEQGVVTLIDRSEADLETVHRTRFNKKDDTVFRIDPVVLGWMEHNRRPVRLRPQLDESPIQARWHADIQSFLCVPLLHKGTLVGLISLFNKKEAEEFTPKDERSLYIIAMQSAQVLENQRLRDKLFEATRNELSQTKESLTEAQKRLIHSEKMAALGQLTAGIAHEIKNPLNFINNFAQLNNALVDDLSDHIVKYKEAIPLDDSDELHSIVEDLKTNTGKIDEHGKRIDGIVRSMIQHSKVATGEKVRTDVNSLVENSLKLVHDTYKEDVLNSEVRIVREYDTQLPPIMLYGQEMGRVLINLLDNAFYAVASGANEDSSPEVILQTRKKNNQVEIAIGDNGEGINAEILPKIFDPFFTTKPTGQGTGLGLSLSHDIVVKGHGGELVVQSKEGQGSTFIIRLPI